MESVIDEIGAQYNFTLLETKPLFGGDINDVYRLKCKEGDYVIKLNNASEFPEMFIAEAKGLLLLKNSESFSIPKVISANTIRTASYLLMEFIPEGSPRPDFWKIFAENLALLHQNTQDDFGLDHNNYIGSLQQPNATCQSAAEFYISQRLDPQFQMAYNNGFRFGDLESSFKNIAAEIPNELPGLIHGDLWHGNYLISIDGRPVLIDPAVAFAPREMDLAMMKLFNGFPDEVFQHYHSVFPLKEGWRNRIQLWQLYYLLVHLNLFGKGYLASVKTILSRFS